MIQYLIGWAALISGLAILIILIHDEVVEFRNYMNK